MRIETRVGAGDGNGVLPFRVIEAGSGPAGLFEPRIVGPVLSGTATAHSDILLHVFADTPESVAFSLMDRGIRHRVVERRVKVQRDEAATFPTFRFESDGCEVDATVFPKDGLRQSPMSPVDGRPMRRATAAELEALLSAGG